jgi:hypothetical protein
MENADVAVNTDTRNKEGYDYIHGGRKHFIWATT